VCISWEASTASHERKSGQPPSSFVLFHRKKEGTKNMSNQSSRKKSISAGKYARLTALADEHGIIAALAMDQRGSL
jgi:hypothetical protein